MKTKKRALAPKGGNDRVWTPPEVAQGIVDHFQPFGRCLEPCKGPGTGAFVVALMNAGIEDVAWCELDEGRDFLTHEETGYDWVVTNPPWSKFRPFLQKSMQVADNVVFLALLNAWFMKARMADMRAAGFGLVEALLLPTPAKPWPQTGFGLAAVHARRDYEGPMTFDSSLMPPSGRF